MKSLNFNFFPQKISSKRLSDIPRMWDHFEELIQLMRIISSTIKIKILVEEDIWHSNLGEII